LTLIEANDQTFARDAFLRITLLCATGLGPSRPVPGGGTYRGAEAGMSTLGAGHLCRNRTPL